MDTAQSCEGYIVAFIIAIGVLQILAINLSLRLLFEEYVFKNIIKVSRNVQKMQFLIIRKP